MTLGDINNKINTLTKTDTVSFPDSERVIDLNIWNQKIFTDVLQAQDSSDADDTNQSGYAVLRTDLVADQRDYNFGITDGVVKIKNVEVSYDASTAYTAYAVDTGDFDEPWMDESLTNIDDRFSQQTPAYGWKGNSFFLFPKPTVSTGKIYVEVSRTAKDFTEAELTTGTVKPGFDLNFHAMLAYGVAHDYFLSNGMTEDAAQMGRIINQYTARLKEQYGNKNEEYPLRLESDYINYN